MCDLSTYQVAITAQYRIPEFREDLKTLYSIVGVENKPTSFLFNDTQVVEEQFLEIVNNMLSTGEVANLYKSDEMENVSRLIRHYFISIWIIIRDATLYRTRSTYGIENQRNWKLTRVSLSTAYEINILLNYFHCLNFCLIFLYFKAKNIFVLLKYKNFFNQ